MKSKILVCSFLCNLSLILSAQSIKSEFPLLEDYIIYLNELDSVSKEMLFDEFEYKLRSEEFGDNNLLNYPGLLEAKIEVEIELINNKIFTGLLNLSMQKDGKARFWYIDFFEVIDSHNQNESNRSPILNPMAFETIFLELQREPKSISTSLVPEATNNSLLSMLLSLDLIKELRFKEVLIRTESSVGAKFYFTKKSDELIWKLVNIK